MICLACNNGRVTHGETNGPGDPPVKHACGIRLRGISNQGDKVAKGINLNNAALIKNVDVSKQGEGRDPVHKQYDLLYDNIAGWAEQPAVVTSSGLIIGQQSADQFQSPIMNVVAVGPDCKFVKPGDRVVFFWSPSMYKVMVDGRVSFVLNEKLVHGILPDKCVIPEDPKEKADA